MKKMTVRLMADFTFEVGYNPEYITFKGAFEKGIIDVTKSRLTVVSDMGNVLEDEEEKDKIIQAILYGLQEKG